MSKCYFIFRYSLFVFRYSFFDIRTQADNQVLNDIRAGVEYQVLRAGPVHNKFGMSKCYFAFRYSLFIFRYWLFGFRCSFFDIWTQADYQVLNIKNLV